MMKGQNNKRTGKKTSLRTCCTLTTRRKTTRKNTNYSEIGECPFSPKPRVPRTMIACELVDDELEQVFSLAVMLSVFRLSCWLGSNRNADKHKTASQFPSHLLCPICAPSPSLFHQLEKEQIQHQQLIVYIQSLYIKTQVCNCS